MKTRSVPVFPLDDADIVAERELKRIVSVVIAELKESPATDILGGRASLRHLWDEFRWFVQEEDDYPLLLGGSMNGAWVETEILPALQECRDFILTELDGLDN